MDPRAIVPLSSVLAYIALSGAARLVLREFGLDLQVGLPQMVIVFAAAGLTFFLFAGFVAPWLYQRALDRAIPATPTMPPAREEVRKDLSMALRTAVSVALFVVSMLSLTLGSASTFGTASGDLGVVQFAWLVVAGISFSGVLIAWAYHTPRFPAPESTWMGYNPDVTFEHAQDLVGKEGIVQAALRPMGNIKLDGRTLVVKSEGFFVDEGTRVRVDRIDGQDIVVVPVGD